MNGLRPPAGLGCSARSFQGSDGDLGAAGTLVAQTNLQTVFLRNGLHYLLLSHYRHVLLNLSMLLCTSASADYLCFHHGKLFLWLLQSLKSDFSLPLCFDLWSRAADNVCMEVTWTSTDVRASSWRSQGMFLLKYATCKCAEMARAESGLNLLKPKMLSGFPAQGLASSLLYFATCKQWGFSNFPVLHPTLFNVLRNYLDMKGRGELVTDKALPVQQRSICPRQPKAKDAQRKALEMRRGEKLQHVENKLGLAWQFKGNYFPLHMLTFHL